MTALIPSSDSSLWTTAIRLRAGISASSILETLARQLVMISTKTSSRIVLALEPTGDSCDTGHWVHLNLEQGIVWADISPWPDRHGGIIPIELDTLLDLAGWQLVKDDPDHTTDHYDANPANLEALLDTCLPTRRLIATAGTDDMALWATQVCDAVDIVFEPPDQRWFMHAEAWTGNRLQAFEPNLTDTPFNLTWSVDLGALLSNHEWQRAIWPSRTEEAALCCQAGLHAYHESPCWPW